MKTVYAVIALILLMLAADVAEARCRGGRGGRRGRCGGGRLHRGHRHRGGSCCPAPVVCCGPAVIVTPADKPKAEQLPSPKDSKKK